MELIARYDPLGGRYKMQWSEHGYPTSADLDDFVQALNAAFKAPDQYALAIAEAMRNFPDNFFSISNATGRLRFERIVGRGIPSLPLPKPPGTSTQRPAGPPPDIGARLKRLKAEIETLGTLAADDALFRMSGGTELLKRASVAMVRAAEIARDLRPEWPEFLRAYETTETFFHSAEKAVDSVTLSQNAKATAVEVLTDKMAGLAAMIELASTGHPRAKSSDEEDEDEEEEERDPRLPPGWSKDDVRWLPAEANEIRVMVSGPLFAKPGSLRFDLKIGNTVHPTLRAAEAVKLLMAGGLTIDEAKDALLSAQATPGRPVLFLPMRPESEEDDDEIDWDNAYDVWLPLDEIAEVKEQIADAVRAKLWQILAPRWRKGRQPDDLEIEVDLNETGSYQVIVSMDDASGESTILVETDVADLDLEPESTTTETPSTTGTSIVSRRRWTAWVSW